MLFKELRQNDNYICEMNVLDWLVTRYFGGILMTSFATWRIWRLLKKTENPEYKEYTDAKGWLNSFLILAMGIAIIIAKLLGKL